MNWFNPRKKGKTRWEKRAECFKVLRDDARAQEDELQRKKHELDKLNQDCDEEKKKWEEDNKKLEREQEFAANLQCLAQYDEEKKQKIDKWKEEFADHNALKQMETLHEEMVKRIIKKKFCDYLLNLLQVDASKTAPATHDSWDTKEQYKIYGLLISACKVKTMEHTDIGTEEEHGDKGVADTTEVEDEGDATTLDKHDKEAYSDNKKEARKLTFDMLKLLPPLVVCQPTAYNEDVQDTEMTWDEENADESHPLVYYRPVLVYGNLLHVAFKGLVGNTRIYIPWVIERDSIILKKELDSGSFGKVCVAMYRNTEVAVKCLHEIILSDYNMSLFIRELGISSQLRHPNIVRFIGATRDEHPIIIVFELMSTSLHKEIQKNRLTTNQVTKVSLDVCAALDYLHHFKPHPILHRDVSSPNVLLNILSTEHWVAKLSDLGSANFVNQVSPGSIAPGNPFYAAPESYNPEQQSPAMDVYSFGVLLMQMSLHKPPAGSPSDRIIQAKTMTAPLFKGIVEQCLQEKGKRPQITDIIKLLS